MFANISDADKEHISAQIKKAPASATTMTKNLGKDLFQTLVNEKAIIAKGSKYFFSEEAKKEFYEKFESKYLDKAPSKVAPKDSSITSNELKLDMKVLDTVNTQIERLTKKIDLLEARMKKLEQLNIIQPKTTNSISSRSFNELLHKNYDLIDYNTNKNGLVSIATLWDKLQKHGVTRSQFETELFTLEKDGVIELKTVKGNKNALDESKALHTSNGGIIDFIKWK